MELHGRALKRAIWDSITLRKRFSFLEPLAYALEHRLHSVGGVALERREDVGIGVQRQGYLAMAEGFHDRSRVGTLSQ